MFVSYGNSLVKEREFWLESFGPVMRIAGEVEESTVTSVLETEPMLHSSAGTSQWHRKRKIEEMEKPEGTPNGEPSSFVWLLKTIQDMGLPNAPPLEVFNQLNVPGLKIECHRGVTAVSPVLGAATTVRVLRDGFSTSHLSEFSHAIVFFPDCQSRICTISSTGAWATVTGRE